jgi:hypothetical protein
MVLASGNPRRRDGSDDCRYGQDAQVKIQLAQTLMLSELSELSKLGELIGASILMYRRVGYPWIQ